MRIEDCLAVIGREPAWSWIVGQFLPAGPSCPGCRAPIETGKALASFFQLRRTYCKECDRVFTPTAGSPIHETSWQPEEFLKLMILSLAGRTPVEIAQHLGKSAATVRDMLAKVELLQVPPVEPPTCPAGHLQHRDKKGCARRRGRG